MPYAWMTSGGKDSMLALDRVRREGLDVRYAVNFYDHETHRVRFHGVRQELIETQAAALGLELIALPTAAANFESVFLETLDDLVARDVAGVVFGNVHLADIREWYEERTSASGLEHLEPLWGAPPIEIAWEVVERGYRPIIISVDPERRAAHLLGREFDADTVTELGTTEDVDPCGEGGEFHTWVFEGPELGTTLAFERGEILSLDGQSVLDILPVSDDGSSNSGVGD